MLESKKIQIKELRENLITEILQRNTTLEYISILLKNTPPECYKIIRSSDLNLWLRQLREEVENRLLVLRNLEVLKMLELNISSSKIASKFQLAEHTIWQIKDHFRKKGVNGYLTFKGIERNSEESFLKSSSATGLTNAQKEVLKQEVLKKVKEEKSMPTLRYWQEYVANNFNKKYRGSTSLHRIIHYEIGLTIEERDLISRYSDNRGRGSNYFTGYQIEEIKTLAEYYLKHNIFPPAKSWYNYFQIRYGVCFSATTGIYNLFRERVGLSISDVNLLNLYSKKNVGFKNSDLIIDKKVEDGKIVELSTEESLKLYALHKPIAETVNAKLIDLKKKDLSQKDREMLLEKVKSNLNRSLFPPAQYWKGFIKREFGVKMATPNIYDYIWNSLGLTKDEKKTIKKICSQKYNLNRIISKYKI